MGRMTRVGVKDLIRCILVEDAGARHFGAVALTRQGAAAAVVAKLFLARNLVRVKCQVVVIIEIAAGARTPSGSASPFAA